MPAQPPPLTGIKVLDLTKLAPGPFCTMILGDLGADIIKIEEPGAPTGRRAEQAGKAGTQGPAAAFSGSPFNALNRNKKSIALNLKSPAGKEIFLRLAQRADVVVEEYRPGVAKRLGIDYETLSVRSPKIIYCAITGYGQDGPYRNLVGHDLNYIATAGVLSILGRSGQLPTIPHNLIADYAGGGMHGAIGILAALVARQQTGRGQFVDISMMDGALALMAQSFSSFFANGKLPVRGETSLDGLIPNYNVYETKDGKIITIGAIEPWFFANLCRALGRDDLIEHEFNSAKRAEIHQFFTESFRTKTRDEWFELLSKTDICVGRMNTLDEVGNDPQVRARRMIVELDAPGGQKVKQVGISVKLSETPGSIRSLAPKLGEHTEEVLHGLGYSVEQIEKWREEGAIK
ncbi:MAG: CaiB/BaiF CoA transferase family protein [Candidatus Binataceae bacterium]